MKVVFWLLVFAVADLLFAVAIGKFLKYCRRQR